MAKTATPSFVPMQTFLTRLRELVKGEIDGEKFDELVRKARGHAGGAAKASRRKAYEGDVALDAAPAMYLGIPLLEKADDRVNYREAEAVGVTCGDCRFYFGGSCRIVEGTIERYNVCDLFAERSMSYAEGYGRVFVESAKSFGEPPEWMPILPTPGTHKHPRWGEVRMTRERNQAFVDNFNAAVYQSRVPVDAEHETKLSGAVGWITALRLNEDGSADAAVEWTDRGVALIEADRYRYVSPEWFDEWEQPETGEVFRDVLIGAAITTRPFFKERSLRPLVANEDGVAPFFQDNDTEDLEMADKPVTPPTAPPAPTAPAQPDPTPTPPNPPAEPPKGASEPVQMAELSRQLSEEKAARQAAEERVSRLEAESRSRRFTDEVMGRSDENGQRWIGAPEKHVATLESLASALGEDSDAVKSYVEQQRSIAKSAREAGLFSEVGSAARTAGGDGTAVGEINSLADKLREGDSKITREQAVADVLADPKNKELAKRYTEERRA